MTITRLSEVIQEWTGWCPQAQVRRRISVIPLADTAASPTGSGDYSDGNPGRLQRFRTWVLMQAIIFSVFIPVFMPILMKQEMYLYLFIAGLFTAMLAFGLRAGMLWKQYEDIRITGAVEESTVEKMVIPALIILFITGTFVIEIVALFGIIPGLDFLMVPVFAVGFSILPWLLLMLVILWEERTGCRLYFNKSRMNLTACTVQGP